jgi:hypothetical protein
VKATWRQGLSTEPAHFMFHFELDRTQTASLSQRLEKAKGSADRQALMDKLAKSEQDFYGDAKNQASLAKLPVSAEQTKQATDLSARLKGASGSVSGMSEECAKLAVDMAQVKPADVKAEFSNPLQFGGALKTITSAPASLKSLKGELSTAGGRMAVLSKALGMLPSGK